MRGTKVFGANFFACYRLVLTSMPLPRTRDRLNSLVPGDLFREEFEVLPVQAGRLPTRSKLRPLRTTTFFFEVNVRGKLLIDGFGYIYNVCTTSMSCPRSNNSIHITMRLGLAGHFGYPRRRCRPYPLVCLPQACDVY